MTICTVSTINKLHFYIKLMTYVALHMLIKYFLNPLANFNLMLT